MIKLINISVFTLLVLMLLGAVYLKINSRNETGQDPDEIIVGTWDSIKPEGIVWVFKANGTMKEASAEIYKQYELIYGASFTQCPDLGMTSASDVYNSDQLVLIIKSLNSPSACYSVSYLDYKQEVDKVLMSLWYAPNGNHLSFKKR